MQMHSLLLFAAATVSMASPIFYSIGADDFGIPRRLTSMDAGTGTVTQVFDLGTTDNGFSGLTYRASTNEFFTVALDGLGDSELVSFQLSGGGAFTPVMALTVTGAPEFNGGLAYDPVDGDFYAMASNSLGVSNFYRIDVGASSITRLFEVLGTGYLDGVTYNAVDNSFYAIQDDSSGSSTLQNITVTGDVGHRTLLFPGFGTGFYGGLSFDESYTNLYALNTDIFGDSSLNQVNGGVPGFVLDAGFGFNNAGLTLGPAAVPEPATVATVLGGLTLLFFRRKK
jgi:hypothetical protein